MDARPRPLGVHFKVRHLGLTNVRGRFNQFTATLVVGDTLDDVSVTASIDMASVDTNQPDRGRTCSRPTSSGPSSTRPWSSARRRSPAGATSTLHGELTINGVTRPVTIPVEFSGVETYPIDGSVHAGFTGEVQVSRGDFGVDFNVPLGVDKLAVGDKVRVELDLQFSEPAPA